MKLCMEAKSVTHPFTTSATCYFPATDLVPIAVHTTLQNLVLRMLNLPLGLNGLIFGSQLFLRSKIRLYRPTLPLGYSTAHDSFLFSRT
jgi:hypothetical protein